MVLLRKCISYPQPGGCGYGINWAEKWYLQWSWQLGNVLSK